MIFVVAIVVGSISALVSRSIVAEADAHRIDETDRWWDPVCPSCGRSLGPTMLRCVEVSHPQRLGNGLTIALTISVSIALALSAPTLWLIPAYVWFGWLMLLLTITDIDTKLIPNRILFPGTAVTAILLLIGSIPGGRLGDFGRGVLGGAVYFVVMLVLALIARGGLGFGDVKLAFTIGLVVGTLSWWYLTYSILWSFILAGLVSIILLATRRIGRRDSIPFGPFMTTAAVGTLIAATGILEWYSG